MCWLSIGHVVDGDEAGDKGEALDDQWHWIYKEIGEGNAENTFFGEKEKQKGTEKYKPK